MVKSFYTGRNWGRRLPIEIKKSVQILQRALESWQRRLLPSTPGIIEFNQAPQCSGNCGIDIKPENEARMLPKANPKAQNRLHLSYLSFDFWPTDGDYQVSTILVKQYKNRSPCFGKCSWNKNGRRVHMYIYTVHTKSNNIIYWEGLKSLFFIFLSGPRILE